MNDKISTKHSGPDSATPYPRSRLSPPIEPPRPYLALMSPPEFIKVGLNEKLQLLGEQIKRLQEMGEKLIQEAQLNIDIHEVPCSVQKTPGRMLHLYTRDDGTNFLSIISPEEWCGLSNLKFGGTYRLENDMSWTRIDSAT